MNFLKLGDLSFQQHCLETYGSIENLIDKAKNGEIDAQADLGCAYSEGFGELLPRDIDKAIRWLNMAVERGYEIPTILGKLGECLDLKGTTLYQQKAFEMYQRAAKLGCTNSQINLGEMYRCGVQGVVSEDLKEAFKWFKRAAGEDVSDLKLGVGGLLAGSMKTIDNAFGGILKRRALGLLYKHYLEGDCPEGQPQQTKAVYYLTRAAELGDSAAQLELGQIYLTGNCGQVKDVAKARRWLQKASAQGDMKAKQLLEECKQYVDTQHTASEVSNEAFVQSLDILGEKLRQRCEAKLHPFVISQQAAFSEEILCKFDWSPTARIYLKAFKLVKEGFEILRKSNFTDEKGITLIAHGYLTENSILQGFHVQLGLLALPQIFQLCEKTLEKNPYFFEGLVLSSALQTFEKEISMEGSKGDMKKIMCIDNLIHFIQKAEPDSLPSQEPFNVDGNYSSWLHVLYYFLAAIYTIGKLYPMAAEAYENSLRCCPAYYESKRGLGYTLMLLYISRLPDKSEELTQFITSKAVKHIHQTINDRIISKYDSWTTEQLRDTAVKVLNEYLVEAPPCHKSYPNVYYYLAQISFLERKMAEFRKYYELGQDAENMRLPFFDPVSLPLKDYMSPVYQLFANMPEPSRCGNRSCIRKVKETELKICSGCRNQKYCSRECQKADRKNHKATCKASKDHRANVST